MRSIVRRRAVLVAPFANGLAIARPARAFRAPHHEGPRLSYLAPYLRVIFRIDLADHPIAAMAFGRIEAGVGALDQRVGVVAGLEYGHADRDRDPAKNFAG